MGKVVVDVILKNSEDLTMEKKGIINSNEIRSKNLPMIIDTGARAVSLPFSVIQELGLPEKRKVVVTLSDGQKQERTIYSHLMVEIQDRNSIFDCIAKLEESPCLIGQLVLETLDFVVDCGNQRLIPNPEAPEGAMLYEDFQSNSGQTLLHLTKGFFFLSGYQQKRIL